MYSTPTDPDPRLLSTLASLNEISATINRMGSGSDTTIDATLRLITSSAIRVVPDASAVIYTFDEAKGHFDAASRVSAGELSMPVPGDEPRPNGLGRRAISERRRVISYLEPDLVIHEVKAQAGAKAVACYPLEVADRTLGVLYVYLHEERHFNQLELLLLDNFVHQAAMAIFQAHQMAQAARNLTRKEEELTRLRRADLLISSRLGLQATLDAILEMALEVTDARHGIFRLVDANGHRLVTAAHAGIDLGRPAVEALPINTTSIMGWVAKLRQPLCIPDLRSNPWSRIYYPLDHDLEMRSELAVPLIGASGRLEGVLNLESPAVGAFDDQDKHLLQALATQAVIAIQEARLLDALQEIVQRLLTQSPQAVFNRLVGMACELLNVPASQIWVQNGDQLILRAASPQHQSASHLPIAEALATRAIRTRGPITYPENSAESARGGPFSGLSGALSGMENSADGGLDLRPSPTPDPEWAATLYIPLLTGEDGKPIGAFGVLSAAGDERRFIESDWDRKVLAVLAHHAVLAEQEAARQEALRAAQEQRAVAETFAAVGDIAANLLHRVNNRVGTIPVRVEGIEDKCQPALSEDPYLAANLEEIRGSAEEAMAIMQDTLFHLRPIHTRPVSVMECVNAAMGNSQLSAGIQVHLEGLTDLPEVMAGPQRLVLVFANLLENAATAMDGQGQVRISGSTQGNWVEIQVADTGPGIPSDLQERIFEFNFSGRRSHAGKLGFGLWWVKTLMARFAGSVSVHSDGHRGTTFVLRLPAAVGNESAG